MRAGAAAWAAVAGAGGGFVLGLREAAARAPYRTPTARSVAASVPR